MARERTSPVRGRDSGRCPVRTVAEVVLRRRRRYALYYLNERSGAAPLEAVARRVAAWEAGTTPDDVAEARIRSVYESLERTHVPRLAAAGLVSYDPASDTVAARIDDPRLEVYLANDPRTSVPWYAVYLGIAALSIGFLAAVLTGIPPISGLDPLAAATIVVFAFAAASVLHWYDVYRWRKRTEGEPPDFLVSVEADEIEDREPPEDDDQGDPDGR